MTAEDEPSEHVRANFEDCTTLESLIAKALDAYISASQARLMDVAAEACAYYGCTYKGLVDSGFCIGATHEGTKLGRFEEGVFKEWVKPT